MENHEVTKVEAQANVSEATSSPTYEDNNGAVQAARRRRPQLDRYISLKPMVAFGLTLQGSWESIAISFQAALLNGGPVSLVYGMILAAVGSTAIAASLGEMASIEPTVGAQYRWTARHTPRRLNPQFWGLLQGWLTFIGWIAGCALTPFVMGSMAQAMIIFNNPNYVPERWHATLLMWAFIIIPLFWNIYARKILVLLEILGGICHFFFFICIVVALIVLAPRSSNDFVWKTLVHDQSGWNDPGVAFCIGLLSPTFVMIAFDGILHMSDEAKDAPKHVPRSMVLTVVINSVFAFAFIIVLLYCMGDYQAVLTTPTGLPIVEVFYQATKSKSGTNTLVAMIFIVYTIGNFNIIASVSRLTWAFARDRGLPFSDFFSYVHPTLKIPINALSLVSVLCMLVCLINIGSKTAFLAILSLPTLSLYISYLLPILFFMLRKLSGRATPRGPFSLGRWGVPINAVALLYGVFIVICVPFPTVLPVTAQNMNYAAPVWGVCFLLALCDWFVSGHKRFRVPEGSEPDPYEAPKD